MQFSAPFRSPPHQRGSVLVTASVFLLVCVIALTGAELGYLFYLKREMQKAADLSALSGVRQLASGGCSGATTEASSKATENLPELGFSVAVSPACGRWAVPTPGNESGFATGVGTPNAVRVQLSANVPPLLPYLGSRILYAQAIAITGEPSATFSVGTRVARVSGDSTLGAVLKTIGLDLNDTTLVSYEGLAQVNITPGGLLQALGIPVAANIGVGEFNALLAANQVSLGSLLDAVATASGQSGLLNVNVTLLNAINAKLGVSSLVVRLGTHPATFPNARGVFAEIIAPDMTAGQALGVNVNALDLIATSIGVATSNRAVSIPGLSVLGNTITAKVGVIEPPSIGIGAVGATAYTGQVRAFVHLNTANLPLLGGLLSNVVKVDLPLVLDVASGKGTISEMCTPELRDTGGQDRAHINVDAEILKVCVGGVDESAIFSTKASCDVGLQNKQLLRVGLLGVNVVNLTTKLQVDPLPGNGVVMLAEGSKATVGNSLLIGSTVKALTDALLATLIGNSLSQGQNAPLSSAQRAEMAKDLFGSPPCSSPACRRDRIQQALTKIQSSSNGLGGFVGSLSSAALDILGSLVNLNVFNLLNSVVGLVSGLLNVVGDLLGGLLGVLLGNSCTGGLLFGVGSDDGCRAQIADSLAGNSGSGAAQTPNAVLALVGFLLDILKPLLDGLGTSVLTPILQNILGLHLGETDVNMMSLKCGGTARLVY